MAEPIQRSLAIGPDSKKVVKAAPEKKEKKEKE